MELFDKITTHIWNHWPFYSTVIICSLIGNVSAHKIFTKERAIKSDFFAFGRMSLPFHPVLAGMMFGTILRTPEVGINFPASMLYFAAAGALSLWLFEAIRRLAGAKGSPFDPTPWTKDDDNA